MANNTTNPSGPGTYCGTLTDSQVRNVYSDECDRVRRFRKGGDGYEAARELRDEARAELIHRGLMHPTER